MQITDVVMSLGVMCNVNMIGRAIFIEGAKALSWGTGSWWALVGLSALGAGTAGLQTYVVGLIAIEICANGGEPIDKSVAARLIDNAKQTYDGFVMEMKRKKVAPRFDHRN